MQVLLKKPHEFKKQRKKIKMIFIKKHLQFNWLYIQFDNKRKSHTRGRMLKIVVDRF